MKVVEWSASIVDIQARHRHREGKLMPCVVAKQTHTYDLVSVVEFCENEPGRIFTRGDGALRKSMITKVFVHSPICPPGAEVLQWHEDKQWQEEPSQQPKPGDAPDNCKMVDQRCFE
jgi:hypothetical protein